MQGQVVQTQLHLATLFLEMVITWRDVWKQSGSHVIIQRLCYGNVAMVLWRVQLSVWPNFHVELVT